ncbi:MAG: OmpA family protein [Pseudomonadota bacterium]
MRRLHLLYAAARRGFTGQGRLFLPTFLALLCTVQAAHAEVVDWDNLTWDPTGTANLSETYSGGDLGVGSVTFSFSGNTDGLFEQPGAPEISSPGINALNTGGLVPPESSLYMATNYDDRTNPEITLTIDFQGYPAGVSDVRFSIFDLDAAVSFTDRVQVTALTFDGVVNPTLIVSGTENGILNDNTVEGLGAPGAPSDSADGTATFIFGQAGIQRITIVYSNPIAIDNPGFQSMSLHDVTFEDFGEADLSIEKTASSAIPVVGDSQVFTLTVNNAGPDDASGIEVTDRIPAGFSFQGDNGNGAYSPATGIWSVPDIPAGGSAALTILTVVNETGPWENTAEVTRSDQFDPDSTPGNNDPDEDDQDSIDTPPRQMPGAVDDFVPTDTDTPVTIPVLDNDTDPEDRPLTITGFTDPPNGTVVLDDNGTPLDPTDDFLVYTPDPGFEGTDTFTYTIENPLGGTDMATVTVVVGPTSILVEKNVSPVTAVPGGVVSYSISLTNNGAIDLVGAQIRDTQPAGFTYLDGSVRVNGQPTDVTVSGGRPLIFDGIEIDRGETLIVSYALVAGAGVTQGEYVNSAEPLFDGVVVGNTGSATVTIVSDPDFDETTIVGKVWADADGDGWQDEGEEGIPGVRLATVEGLLIETDQHGRYHIAAVDGGFMERGRNFIVKVDPSTLPAGSEFTTENPRVRRITRGLMNRFDFGVRLPYDDVCCQTVEVKLSEVFFNSNSDQVRPEYLRVMQQFADRLRATGGGIIRIEGNAALNEGERPAPPPEATFKDYSLTPRFDTRKATLKGGDREALDRIIREWRGVENVAIEVTGHTDNVRIAPQHRNEYRDNYALSLARASTVGEYVAQALGVDQSRVIVRGAGPDEPVATNATAAGRAQNRRVVLTMRGEGAPEAVPGAGRVAFADAVYNRELAEKRALRVYLALKSFLGEEMIRDVDFEIVASRDAPPPADEERVCGQEDCEVEAGYAVRMLTGLEARRSSPDDTHYAADGRRVDVSGEFVVGLQEGGALWATEDPAAMDPRLSVTGPAQVRVVGGRTSSIEFHVYTNYSAFMDRMELVIYRDTDEDRVTPLAVLPVDLAGFAQVRWPGGENLADGEVLRYHVRAYDAEGRVDETAFSRFTLLDDEDLEDNRATPLRRAATPPAGEDGDGTIALQTGTDGPLHGNVLVFRPPDRDRREQSQQYTLTPKFGTRRIDLSAEDRAELERIANQWVDATNVRIHAAGHTDNVRIAPRNRREFANNQVLSEARARSVANYVAGILGLPESQVDTVGMADRQPVVSNATPEGRARNRRVELRITGDRQVVSLDVPADVRLVDTERTMEEEVTLSIDEAENFLGVRQEIEVPDVSLETVRESRELATAWNAQDSAEALQQIYGTNQLVQQNIPMRGSRVRLHGRDVGNHAGLVIGGKPMPMDVNGDFTVEYLLPTGQHNLQVGFTDTSGRVVEQTDVPANVTGKYMFMVALADLTWSENDLSGSVEPLSADDRYAEDTLTEGRVALYLKGKIKGKYLVTAQLDTTEEELSDLVSNIDQKNPREVFRRLDPDRYYPVYGDDSTTIADTNSQGRLYVRAEWDKSEALWGNYHTDLTGTEFAQYNRSLYGGKVHYRSTKTTELGAPKLDAIVFGSETQTALGHTEFTGTGGSLFYLRHRDILPGSEKAKIEVRDRDSNRVIENVALTRGVDYEVDEIQGRIILARPLAQVADLFGASLVKDSPLDGNRVFLLVDYEYVPTGFDTNQLTTGARGKLWLGDHFAIGGTYVDEARSGEDYGLTGVDVTLQAARGTYLKAEIASTEANQAARFRSDDGGLSFVDTGAAVPDREGDALALEGRLNFKEMLNTNSEWIVGGWFRDSDAGYSTSRLDRNLDTQELGGEIMGEIGSHLNVAGRYSSIEQDLGADETRASVQADLSIGDKSVLSAEYRYSETELNTGSGASGDISVAALRYSYDLSGRTQLFATGQFTLDNSLDAGTASAAERARLERRTDDNNLFSVGARFNISDHTNLQGEVSSGDRGEGVRMTLDHQINARQSIYGTYTHSTDRTANRSGSQVSVGQRRQISNQASLFSEMQFVEEEGYSGIGHVFGLDFALERGWTIGLAAQSGLLEGLAGLIDRDAGSITVGYHNDDLRWSSKVEYRNDNGISDLRQVLSSNRFDWKFGNGFTLLARANFSDTADQQTSEGDATFFETGIGIAYRPIDNDRLNLLGKVTYLYDLPGLYQINTGTDQRSLIASLEGIYRLSRRWEIGAKLAQRQGDLRESRSSGDWYESTTSFAAIRARYHLIRKWDGILEYRALEVDEAKSTRQGYLAGIERHFGDHLKLGIGYNFTDFSDNLANLDYDHKGWFLNAVGKY